MIQYTICLIYVDGTIITEPKSNTIGGLITSLGVSKNDQIHTFELRDESNLGVFIYLQKKKIRIVLSIYPSASNISELNGSNLLKHWIVVTPSWPNFECYKRRNFWEILEFWLPSLSNIRLTWNWSTEILVNISTFWVHYQNISTLVLLAYYETIKFLSLVYIETTSIMTLKLKIDCNNLTQNRFNAYS